MTTAVPDLSPVHPALSHPPVDMVLLGLGQVGTALARAVLDVAPPDAGRLRLQGALVRDTSKVRGVRLPKSAVLTTDAQAIFACRPAVVVELLGGVDPAFALVSRALAERIPVVTANKSLLAAHGPELQALASRTGTPLLYEASVLAGVPFLGPLSRRPLASRVTRLTGVVNGTSNFILTAMEETGAGMSAALLDAQHRGLAEADPRNDVSGADAAEKLSVLLQHFGWGHLRPERIETVGIDSVEAQDVSAAREFGGVLKPVVLAERTPDGAAAFVGPCYVPSDSPLARVSGADNGLSLRNSYGELFYSGPGAGPAATAATVLDDVFEVASGARHASHTAPIEQRNAPLAARAPDSGWFVRFTSGARLPAPEAIADLLGSHGIWLRRTSVRRSHEGTEAAWALTWPTSRARIDYALATLSRASRCEALALRALES